MTAKIKARELVNRYWDGLDIGFFDSKQCALICVDEILNTTLVSPPKKYWIEVKQEIEKL